ncbi:MAG: alpha/beta hydrolase [Nitrososphaerales archaeon]|nr:alpha/beta hydrolase [Nitrososphaerales archaeon]
MPTAAVNGVTLHYEEKGTGKPLLFVHGIPTDYRAWTRQVKEFADSFRAVTFSRRYAAPNTRTGDLLDSTVGNNASDLKGLIEKLGLAPANLVGHSYGGFISAFLAADHPDLVRSLTLVEPAISTMLVVNEKSPAQMLGLLLRSPSVALSARKFQSTSLYPSLKALDAGQTDKATELMVDGIQDSRGAFNRFAEEERKMMLENGRTIGELKTRFPAFRKAEASRISCRALVLNGESSPLWLRKIGELLAKAIPKSEYARVPGSAHFPHIQNPVEFNRQLRAFLSAP